MNIQALAPRFWGVWLLIGVMRLVTLLPYRVQLFLGRTIGKLAFYCAPYRRHITEVNLRLCFPHFTPLQLRLCTQRCFESAGMGMVETGMAWWMSDRRLKHRLHVHGQAYLDQALQADASVIVLGAHFTCLEIVGRLCALQNNRFDLLYKPHKNAVFNALMLKKRARYVDKVIAKDNVRELMRSIQAKKVIWYAPDQDYGKKHSVFALFFGIQTATIAVLPRLIKKKPVVVVPAHYHRLDNNQGYEIIFHPPLASFPSGDDIKDATQINQLLENDLRAHPEQYLWQHRRFKTRPAGEESFYTHGSRRSSGGA